MATTWEAREVYKFEDAHQYSIYTQAWGTYDSNGAEVDFHYLETYQIVVDNEGWMSLYIWANDIGDPWTHYKIYRKNDYSMVGPYELDLNDEKQFQVTKAEPVHLTVVLSTSNGEVDATTTYPIWISVRPDDPPSDVAISIQGDLSWSDAESDATWDAAIAAQTITGVTDLFARPQWNVGDGWLGYYGSLVRLAGQTGTVDITLGDGIVTDIPLTSSSWKCINLNTGNVNIFAASGSKEAQTSLEAYLWQLSGQFISDNFQDPILDEKVKWIGFELDECVKGADIDAKLYIRGFGIVSGFNLAGKGSWGTTFPQYDKAWNGQVTLRYVLQYVEYLILSGLIEVSSRNAFDSAAIKVENVQTGYAPKRYMGAIQVNSNYRRMYTYDNNRPAVLFDVKTPGTWLDGSDGPEVMGGVDATYKTYLHYLYLHIADDSLKMSVSYWKAEDIVLLQGNVGGIINIGSYGDIRGTSMWQVSASGLWVHRITQRGDQQFDSKGGMIVTRNGCTKTEIRDALVEEVWVSSLGGVLTPGQDSGLNGPNCMYRLFSLGFDPAGIFAAESPGFTNIYNLQVIKIHSFVEPQSKSLFYNIRDSAGQAWGFMTVSFVYCECSEFHDDGTCSQDDPCKSNPKFNPFEPSNYAGSAAQITRAHDEDSWYSVNGFTDGSLTYDSSYEATGKDGNPNNVDFYPGSSDDTMSAWTFNYAIVPP